MSLGHPDRADSDSAELIGLTQVEVDQCIAAGEVNDAPDASSRSFASIIKENTLTWFNFLIGSMWIVMLIVAPWQDSLFGLVIVANTLIGTIQEYRASRTLEKLAVIGEAKPVVRRDGTDQEISAKQIVLGDLIVLRTGDQLVVDGEIEISQGLEIDESLLTGEADPVDKHIGDSAMSGSFVVAGSGYMRATKVGRNSFAAGRTQNFVSQSTSSLNTCHISCFPWAWHFSCPNYSERNCHWMKQSGEQSLESSPWCQRDWFF
jgi:cation-transporting ATPase E